MARGPARCTQPVPFSHQHHVGDLGIDCRYCHTAVEKSSYAGMPPTETCMNCHSQIWVGSDMLAPVRESYRTDQSLHWQRIYNLPGFVYFDHSIHIHKGIGCTTCHGRIDEMPITFQMPSLLMEWCLDCHRHPEPNLRPPGEIFNVKWQAAGQSNGARAASWPSNTTSRIRKSYQLLSVPSMNSPQRPVAGIRRTLGPAGTRKGRNIGAPWMSSPTATRSGR